MRVLRVPRTRYVRIRTLVFELKKRSNKLT